MKGVKIKAYAKINLVLDVLRKREDGYHEVEMIMQAISLHDLLTLKPSEGISITATHPMVPLDKRNLAYQAAELIINKYPKISGVKINIEKQIPIEAGLAGGSTDAAAVILGMNQLFNLNLTQLDMFNIGAILGSDVPFCISGNTSLATGRGEMIEEVSPCPPMWVLLIKPSFGVKTAEVYKKLDLSEVNDHPDVNGYLKALRNADVSYLLNNIGNVLEYSTFKLYPKVRDLKDKIKQMGAVNVLMSGSGPTILALFNSQNEAQALANTLKQKLDGQVFIAYTLSKRELEERMMII